MSGASRVTVVSTYPPQVQALGGGGWVDRRILAQLSEQRLTATSFPVATLSSTTSSVPLRVRGDKRLMTRTLLRMLRSREPYGVAKFSHSSQWPERARELREAAGTHQIVASQFPSLLLCRAAGITPTVYVAHNAEHVLGRQHNPRALEIAWQDSARLRTAERDALQGIPVIAALSKQDVAIFKNWHADVRHLPLARAPRSRAQRPWTIGFIGKLDWPPNAEALRLLTDGVLPLVRRVMHEHTPALLLAGRGSSTWRGAGVSGLGEVVDVEDFYRRVGLVVVPRLGATTGVSVKLLEALEHGVPVLCPRALAAAAGLEDRVLVADDAAEMAEVLITFFRGRDRATEPGAGSVVPPFAWVDLFAG